MKITYKPTIVSKNKQLQQTQEKKSNWDKLVTSIVRPPRYRYQQAQLGHRSLEINNRIFSRVDLTVDHLLQKISVTIFQPVDKNNQLILFLHANSSSKCQAKNILKFIPRKFSLACFDFIGCGNNDEAEHISLGVRESNQVETVVNQLRRKNFNVAIWGRSMGAVSALKYGKVDIIVADSPFRSMKKLCKDVVQKSKPRIVPSCLISCIFPCVFLKLKSDVKTRAEYDMQELDTQKAVKNISPATTLILLSGDKDDLVHHHNSQKLYKLFPGKNKYLEIFAGTHNSIRPDRTILKIMDLIEKHAYLFQRRDIIDDVIKIQEINMNVMGEQNGYTKPRSDISQF